MVKNGDESHIRKKTHQLNKSKYKGSTCCFPKLFSAFPHGPTSIEVQTPPGQHAFARTEDRQGSLVATSLGGDKRGEMIQFDIFFRWVETTTS